MPPFLPTGSQPLSASPLRVAEWTDACWFERTRVRACGCRCVVDGCWLTLHLQFRHHHTLHLLQVAIARKKRQAALARRRKQRKESKRRQKLYAPILDSSGGSDGGTTGGGPAKGTAAGDIKDSGCVDSLVSGVSSGSIFKELAARE